MRILVYIWATFSSLVVVIGYFCLYYRKNQLINEMQLTVNRAYFLDCLPLVIFTFFFLSLIGVLIRFWVLQRRYDICIKKSQLVFTFLLGLFAVILGALQLYSGTLQLELNQMTLDKCLETFPNTIMLGSIISQCISLILALLIACIMAQIFLNIGKSGEERFNENK